MNILFVCTGNTCRSPMAQRLMQSEIDERRCADRIQVLSAGLSALEEDTISEEAVLALQEYGIDARGQNSNRVTPQLLDETDLILTMTRFHSKMLLALNPQIQHKTFLFADYLQFNSEKIGPAHMDPDGWFEEVMDPFGQSLEVYRLCAQQLRRMVQALTDIVCE